VKLFRAEFFDFSNQYGEIGTFKTEPRRWNASMLDVLPDMFVMRMSARKRLVVGMRPRIVPPNLLAALIKFVTVCSDQFVVEIQELAHAQNRVVGEMQFAFNLRGVNARANKNER